MEPEVEQELRKQLNMLDRELVDAIVSKSASVTLEAGQELLRHGQYVKVVPLVLDGLIKVYARYEEKELLLYYIQPNESCVMSFSAALQNAPSEVFAVTEEPTSAILLPADELQEWTRQYPGLNRLFFTLFNTRYSELIDTINHLLYQKMDMRLLDFLKGRTEVTGKSVVKMSHRRIANELGTAREVITRVMKKLEVEGKVAQREEGIELL
ncbi:MAG: Crp/Fnr family transcriptional regulator [Flavobacteriales bacterium]|nr:Crp/Fnr family transcriptional regulator [Flavobacteriales bacterium]